VVAGDSVLPLAAVEPFLEALVGSTSDEGMVLASGDLILE
jgi:hypothetical protein